MSACRLVDILDQNTGLCTCHNTTQITFLRIRSRWGPVWLQTVNVVWNVSVCLHEKPGTGQQEETTELPLIKTASEETGRAGRPELKNV